MAGLDTTELAQILQILFVCTGCDYISFFSGLGKATFLRYFFQYATFITGINAQGSLANIHLQRDDYKQGFLAFLRLVGTVYYASGFDMPSPESHFLQFSTACNQLAHHQQWINDVRQNIADRSTFDNSMMPSTEALCFHWKRASWVLHMWAQSDRNHMVLEPITEYGWSLEDGQLKVTWDTEENMRTVRERLNVLLKGCKCITGCKNRICGCRKKGTFCSEGCQCTNCENHGLPTQDREDLADIALEEVVQSNTTSEEDDENEFAEFVFAAAFDVNTELELLQ